MTRIAGFLNYDQIITPCTYTGFSISVFPHYTSVSSGPNWSQIPCMFICDSDSDPPLFVRKKKNSKKAKIRLIWFNLFVRMCGRHAYMLVITIPTCWSNDYYDYGMIENIEFSVVNTSYNVFPLAVLSVHQLHSCLLHAQYICIQVCCLFIEW